MRVNIKRIYEPARREDGIRVLADRIWPRGVSKEKAAIHEWAKDITPSTGLRKWYHADPTRRWIQFKKRYEQELKDHKESINALRDACKNKTVTLVSAVKEPKRSHVLILSRFLRKNE